MIYMLPKTSPNELQLAAPEHTKHVCHGQIVHDVTDDYCVSQAHFIHLPLPSQCLPAVYLH